MTPKLRNLLIIGIIILFLIIILSSVGRVYDNAVKLEEQVKAAWANVESAYQRRSDLIPNLVNTVKGYAQFEQQTLTQVIEARTKATQIKISPENLTPESINKFQEAQDALTSALGRLLVVVERYPELKANQNFLELQAQLEGTENRINVARNKYNEAVQQFNSYIRGFYRRLILKLAGGNFQIKEPFKAQPSAAEAPRVEF